MEGLSFEFAYGFIFFCTSLGFSFALWNLFDVLSINTKDFFPDTAFERLLSLEDQESAKKSGKDLERQSIDHILMMNQTSEKIQKGAVQFLRAEYTYLAIFLLLFGILILLADKFRLYTVIAFFVGAVTSILSGYLGMYIATRTNVRVTYLAYLSKNENERYKSAFNVAFKGGCVMGFFLVSLALTILTALIAIYLHYAHVHTITQYRTMFEFIAGYGLGGSTVALFCRVGGGIYTKAADVGSDLVGKLTMGLEEDEASNPGVIADNVGDNVGDIAGMGSDLFGSFSESTCAALVVSGTSVGLTSGANFLWPLVLSSCGILVCIATAFFATHVMEVNERRKIQVTLQWQLIISTAMLTPVIILLSLLALPSEFSFVTGRENYQVTFYATNWGVMICALTGLYAGMAIGYITDYFTSHAHSPTRNLAQSCKSGPAISIINGLALGYLSCIVPIIALAS